MRVIVSTGHRHIAIDPVGQITADAIGVIISTAASEIIDLIIEISSDKQISEEFVIDGYTNLGPEIARRVAFIRRLEVTLTGKGRLKSARSDSS